VETSVTVPPGAGGGTVTIVEILPTETPPPGFIFIGHQVNITAPDASVENPLIVTFNLHSSIAGTDPNAFEMFKASVLIGACTGAGAVPDPCVESRTLVGDNIQIIIRTSTASPWNFGKSTATPTVSPTVSPTASPTATPSPTPIGDPLSRKQQMCVKEMNKNGEKVNRAQLKVNERCLINLQKGKLGGPPSLAFSVCMVADANNRVHRATERTAKREERKCDSLDELPPFGYTDAETVNIAAKSGGRAVANWIFGGPPVIDSNLFTNDDRKEASCQLEMLRRAGKLETTVVKAILKEKRMVIKEDSVDSGVALETRLQAVFFSDVKMIEKAEDRLVKQVNKKCATLPVSPETLFPGSCGQGNPTLSAVEDCVIAAARCEACLKINAFDALNMNCELADDHMDNGSCQESGESALTNFDCFPRTAPDDASQIAKTCVALANSAPDMIFTKQDYQGMPDQCKFLVAEQCR